MFKSGQAIVDTFTASAMVQVYDALKPALKKHFETMIKDKVGFMKTQAFAMKMIG
jgi:glycine betaine/choline ABC-type transport system substrate-binding protein